MNYWRFDHVSELVDAVNAACAIPGNERMKDHTAEAGWYCNDRRHITTVAACIRAMSEPTFQAGVDRLERMAKLVDAPTPISIKRKLTRGDHGDELDMGRVWQGDLDNAWTRAARRHTVSVARVLVCVFVGGHADLRAEELAWRGVAGLAFADALEGAGYSVEVRAIRRAGLSIDGKSTSAKDAEYWHDVDVTIKPAGQPLDVHKAASLIASPVLFRGAMLAHAATVSRWQLDYGTSKTHPDRADVRDGTGFDFACVVPHAVMNQTAAQAWLAKTAAQLRAVEHTD